METKVPNGEQIRDDKSLTKQILAASQTIGEFFVLIVQIVYAIVESIYRVLVPIEPKSVQGDIVLITGTGHGIGRELALAYAVEGATVVGWDIDQKNNDETIREIISKGYPKAYSYVCDVSNREQVSQVSKQVLSEVGDVTILINNAGIMPTHPLLDQTEKEIESQFKINVLAHFWTIQAFLPTMKKNNRGHIVALSSIAGLMGLENLVPYCGTKFAVRGIMEALQEELRLVKGCKIETTCICPYMVDTGLCKRPRVKFGSLMPLLPPKEVANAIMCAQRRADRIVTVPKFMYFASNMTRCLPMKAATYVKDFVDSGVESDL